MKAFQFLICIASLLLAGAAPVISQTPTPQNPAANPPPAKATGNNQAKDTSETAAIDMDYLFHQLDRNNDGKIDRTGFQGLPTILSAIAAGARKTGTGHAAKGSVSSGSAAALGDPDELFKRLDTNHDGTLSREEFERLGPMLGITSSKDNPPNGKTPQDKSDKAERGTNLPGVGSGGSSSGSRETGPAR